MRTPVRPLPEPVGRWAARARYVRWLDAVAGGLVVWALLTLVPGETPASARALLALVLLGLVAPIRYLRFRWRPVSGPVGLWLSRALGPGDRAWYVRPGAAELVIVTARRGARVTIATAAPGVAEGINVRRTRVLLVPTV